MGLSTAEVRVGPHVGQPALRWAGSWLYGPCTDLGILVLPIVLVVLVAFFAADGLDEPLFGGVSRLYAGWFSQFVLGNTTHVILTFLLLGVRQDVLRATKGQARTIACAAAAAFTMSVGLLWLTGITYPVWTGFGMAVVTVFAVHHWLSQSKGYWSLYHLRSLAAPSVEERTVQRYFVPIALLLILVRMLFIPLRAGSHTSFLNPLPVLVEPVLMDYAVTWVLFCAWAVYAIMLFRTLWRSSAEVLSGPKLLYVSTHTAVVGVTIVWPAWGMILAGGIHGLEYFCITGRMLRPMDVDGDRLPARMVIPAMVITMVPLFVIGVLNAPFTNKVGIEYTPVFHILALVMNGIVVAHYAADAFMYRFRIPEVRNVALRRLGVRMG